MTIPSGVASLDQVFNDCPALEAYAVSEASLHFSAKDGVLFNHDQSILISYPSAKSSTSYDCPQLIALTIPEGVTAIWFSAFEVCYSLKKITLPACLISETASSCIPP